MDAWIWQQEQRDNASAILKMGEGYVHSINPNSSEPLLTVVAATGGRSPHAQYGSGLA